MVKRWLLLILAALVTAFLYGFVNSYSTGIQPGYFEKAEAPAYGVGGDLLGAEMGDEFQKHLQELYGGDLEED